MSISLSVSPAQTFFLIDPTNERRRGCQRQWWCSWINLLLEKCFAFVMYSNYVWEVQRVFFIFRDDGNSVRSTPIIQVKLWDTLARPAAAAAPMLGNYNRGNRSTADKSEWWTWRNVAGCGTDDLLGNRRDKLSLGSSSNEKAKDYRVKVKGRLAG